MLFNHSQVCNTTQFIIQSHTIYIYNIKVYHYIIYNKCYKLIIHNIG